MSHSLAKLDDDELRTLCTQILMGANTPYDGATRGVGRSIELVVAEMERLRGNTEATSNRERSQAKARLKAIASGAQTVGQQLVNAASTGQQLSDEQANAVETWCSFVSLSHDPEFNEIACDLHSYLRPFGGRLLNLVSATAVAATSSFRTPAEGILYWEKYLDDKWLPNYAIDFFIRHAPQDSRLEDALIRLWQGALLNFVDVSVEGLALAYCERLSKITGQAVSEHFKRIFNKISPALLPEIISQIQGRKRFDDMLRAAKLVQSASSSVLLDPALTEWLKSIKVQPEHFNPSDKYPEEINQALTEYLANWQPLRVIGGLPETELRQYMYPSQFKIPPDGHKQLEAWFFKAFASKQQSLQDLELLPDSQIPDLDSRLASRAKVLLQVAFFFRTGSRRQDKWGVIPLGRQRTFGLLMHKKLFNKAFPKMTPDQYDTAITNEATSDSALSDQLRRIQEKHSGDIIGARWNEQESLNCIVKIYKAIPKGETNHIYIREGFVMDDLLIEMLTRDRPELVPKVHRIMRSVRIDSEKEFPMLPTWDRDSKSENKSLQHQESVALFDLGRLPQVLEGMHGPTHGSNFEQAAGKSDFVIVLLKHGLDIPVGIGFSLPFLPFLFVRSDWCNGREEFLFEAIRSISAQSLLKPLGDNWLELFLGIGIDLAEYKNFTEPTGNVIPLRNARGR